MVTSEGTGPGVGVGVGIPWGKSMRLWVQATERTTKTQNDEIFQNLPMKFPKLRIEFVSLTQK
jgi:hypothetical protein